MALLGNFSTFLILPQVTRELVEWVIQIYVGAKGQAHHETMLRTPHLSVQDQGRGNRCNEQE